MKGSHKILLALLFVAMLFGYGCKPKDCNKDGSCAEEYYRNRIGGLKDYLYALKGSYWIYKNSKTGELDTQTCIGATTYWVTAHGTTNYAKHITVDYEVLYRRIFSTYNQWVYVDKTSFYNPDAMRPFKTNLYRDVYGQGQNNPFWYPALKNDQGGSGGTFTITTCTNIDTSIVVNGQTYDHVVVFDVNIDEIWEEKLGCIRPNTKYYWVKNIGLIRKTMNRCNYSWDLIDYKIIP